MRILLAFGYVPAWLIHVGSVNPEYNNICPFLCTGISSCNCYMRQLQDVLEIIDLAL